jgi:hypothetical protein
MHVSRYKVAIEAIVYDTVEAIVYVGEAYTSFVLYCTKVPQN